MNFPIASPLGKKRFRELLVHYGHSLRFVSISLVERSAAQQRNLHYLEIAWRHRRDLRREWVARIVRHMWFWADFTGYGVNQDLSGQKLPRGQASRRRAGMVVKYASCLVCAERPHPARPRSKRNRSHLIVSDNALFLLSAAYDFKLVSGPFPCQQLHRVPIYIGHIFCWPKLLQLAGKTVVGVRSGKCVFKFVDFAQTSNRRSFVLGNASIVKRWSKNYEQCKK